MREPEPETRELLPEYTRYRDEGCDLFPSCLGCPLPRCRYDNTEGGKQPIKEGRNREILRLHNLEGKGVQELAEIFGVSKRTIQRIIRRDSDE